MGKSAPRVDGNGDPTAQLLGMVAARLSRLHRERLAQPDVGLTFRQYRTLVRISDGCTSLTELASLANLTIAAVSENVDVLARRGLLTRKRRSDDRRALTLAITPKGSDVLSSGDRAFHEISESLIAQFSDGERELLNKFLEQMYEEATVLFRKTFGRGSAGVD